MVHIDDLPVEILHKILANLDIPDGSSGIDDAAPYALDGCQVPKRSSAEQENLTSATLVCKGWSKVAQCILFSIIEMCYTAEPLLAVLQRRGDLAASIEMLTVRPHPSFAQELVPGPAVLRLLPNLQAYSLCPYTHEVRAAKEHFPTDSYNPRLQYFASSRIGRESLLEIPELHTDAYLDLDLPRCLKRLDLRNVRLGPAKLPCLENLSTLCIDGNSFTSLSCDAFKNCPSLRSLYLQGTPAFSDDAVFSGIEYLCTQVRPSPFLQKNFPNIRRLDIIDWLGDDAGERVAKELPMHLKALTWTCMEGNGISNVRTLLHEMGKPSFLPVLEFVPEIYGNSMQFPDTSNSLDSATLELITQATKVFAKRHLPSSRSCRRGLPFHRFYDIKIFPAS